MSRIRKILLALDSLCGNLLFAGIVPGETISSYCWRQGYSARVRLIDFFFYTGHCRDTYEAEHRLSCPAGEGAAP
jgi:hypothetical protein